jgi:uncharacterized FAD-dependent dehydrogenase
MSSENIPKRSRTWRLLNLQLGIERPEAELLSLACQKLGIERDRLRGFRVARKALDARRRRGGFNYVYHVDLILDEGLATPAMISAEQAGRLTAAPVHATLKIAFVHPSVQGKAVVIVGSGPGGLFAAHVLAANGVKVELIDRGASLQERGSRLVRFHRTRQVDTESNLLFGEGGAGTYSDGKIYTRVDDPLEITLLEALVSCGAPAEILYDARAHIGTDRLHGIIPRFREQLASNGVTFSWNTRCEDLVLDGADSSRVVAIGTNKGEIPCGALILATGHSAGDTWRRLHEQGVLFEAKPFQLGVRIEHPQELITRARYGTGKQADLLGAASYNLICKAKGDVPATYSFCMCPGGRIVASVNRDGMLCTNGMSNSTHSFPWANAALVSTFVPEEFSAYGEGPFAGLAMQRHFEKLFFDAGGGDYTAPAQRAADFLASRDSSGTLKSSYRFGTTPARFDQLLPPRIQAALSAALNRFDRMIPGFAGPDGLLVGIESRSSGPVRMPRDHQSRRANGFSNLFPVGEGAGYSGGIMSSALDGARSALALLKYGIQP